MVVIKDPLLSLRKAQPGAAARARDGRRLGGQPDPASALDGFLLAVLSAARASRAP